MSEIRFGHVDMVTQESVGEKYRWGCHLWGGLMDQHSKRSQPNKAVDVVLVKLVG